MTPTLVLPCGVVKSLGATELLHVVLHELAHVRRRDLIWNWPAEIARVLYFFHPVAHWACRQIRLERELACDALALAASQSSSADYADTLVRVVSHVSQPNATCTE